MTSEKMLQIIEAYRSLFEILGIQPQYFEHDELTGPDDEVDVLAHCFGMLSKMETFIAEGRIEKAMRWLGFIQGCLFACSLLTIEELKEHSRPD